MKAIFFSPPVIFILLFFSIAMSSKWLSRFSHKGDLGEHAGDSYACGQRDVENYVNPDYSKYYPYAFIFTVIHILILVVATSPSDVQILPVIYIISGILAILIAFKR